ncbi:unnamed protein product, partial [Iphiclides podalirius]
MMNAMWSSLHRPLDKNSTGGRSNDGQVFLASTGIPSSWSIHGHPTRDGRFVENQLTTEAGCPNQIGSQLRRLTVTRLRRIDIVPTTHVRDMYTFKRAHLPSCAASLASSCNAYSCPTNR